MIRIDKNYDYYKTNPMIKGTFDFFEIGSRQLVQK